MTKLMRYILMVGVIGIFVGCMSRSVLTYKDNGELVKIKTSDEVLVELEGDASSGYVWEIEQFDPNIVVPVGKPVFERRNYEDDTDMTGVYTFKFISTGYGKTPLKIVYKRPWENDVEPADVYQAEVVVMPK